MRQTMHGTAPLTARLEPWMEELLTNPALCRELIDVHGSPVNLHDFSAMGRNVAQLRAAADAHGIDFEIYFARKANKTLGAIDQAVREDCGVDVASLNELRQSLERGVPPERIIVTAAVKSRALLRLAIESHVTISFDNENELRDALEISGERQPPLVAALRLAVAHPSIPPTRFGLPSTQWLAVLRDEGLKHRVKVAGIHFHLNGYDAGSRALGISEALSLIEQLRTLGQDPSFVDMGGGIPMSYLDSASEWGQFWSALEHLPAGDESLTWKSDRLGAVGGPPAAGVYPYHQELVRAEWLDHILTTKPESGQSSIASALRAAQIQLRCEPGRSLLDGCGLTLAEVAFSKHRSDGVPLVGLHMNRTQCRSTSADFLVDPVLVHATHPQRERTFDSAFLVGAYCIEEELLLRRRFEFPGGVAAGDLVAFPNTAGYLMHIVESASHQLPLAANVLWDGGRWVADDIDPPH
ncbi:hypothetical protein ART_0391 [Arthrobacter sp. PAMC 25486]|uniref:alanine racemase n=1 Tax=Arthrobacter sp. PAMC 25486 TaxID=1494608 RepID=UPI000535AAB1|nr:alanine racemase [Arthrobacter sp. PAMC 25486]AIX99989.1 hypothetical protein ART_0391 [Arthrobacter sp. PAMC 25486]